MTKWMIALLASSVLAAGVPAIAQAHSDDQYGAYSHDDDNDWNNGGASYEQFDEEYRHIWAGIQHGLSDGSYTRREAQQFYREMQRIRARADWEQRNGDYDSDETQARLESPHERMHTAHERGHQRQNEYYGWRQY